MSINIGPGSTVYLNFSADINPRTVEHLIAASTDICARKAAVLNLMLSTPGGHVVSGITLYNHLRALPIELNTHNMGNVDSIGNVIFLAGKKRYACPHSTFMFHGVGVGLNEKSRLERKALREILGGLESDEKRIGEIVAERTTLTVEKVSGFFLEARTLDAQWALDNGVVDEIRSANIPAGSPVISLVLSG